MQAILDSIGVSFRRGFSSGSINVSAEKQNNQNYLSGERSSK